MPTKPKHPCAFPMCPNLTNTKYCEEHQWKANEEEEAREKYRYNLNKERRLKRDTKLLNKRYGREWQKIRNRFIYEHPLCEMCLLDNRYVNAEEVHHIVPLSKGGTHNASNLQALCKKCHSKITMSTNHEDGIMQQRGRAI